MSIKNIINEEIESFYSANFPEFGERLHNLNEIGEANLPPYNYTIDNISDFEIQYNFDTETGDDYIVMFEMIDRIKRIWHLQFGIAGGTPSDVVNKGNREKVMSTIVKIVNDFIDKFKPNQVRFEPSKDTEYEKMHGKEDVRRYKMYMEYIKKNMRNDYQVYEYHPYIIIERKIPITDKNIVKV